MELERYQNNMTTSSNPDIKAGSHEDPGTGKKNGKGKEQPETISKDLLLLIVASALGGFLFGYDTGVVSGAMLLIRDEFHLTTIWHELIVSITLAAAWISSIVAGPSSDKWGRRIVILVSSAVFTVGAVAMGVASDEWVLLIGRTIIGVGIGFTSMCVPVYISEVSPSDMRGRLTVLNTLFLTGGQFVASLVCGGFSTVDQGWRWMLGLGAVPSALQFVAFLFAPESPRWLARAGRKDEAKRVLSKFRSNESDIDAEIKSYSSTEEAELTEEKAEPTNKNAMKAIMQSRPVRRALTIGCLLQMFQQLTGINTVMYYSASIITMAGVTDSSTAIWLTCVTSFFNFSFTFVGLWLVERIGRRILVLSSLLGVSFALLCLALSFHLSYLTGADVLVPFAGTKCSLFMSCSSCTEDPDCGFCFQQAEVGDVINSSCLLSSHQAYNELSINGPCSSSGVDDVTFSYNWCPSQWAWLSVVGLCLYLMFFAPGMGSMPWTINSEIYPQWARATCVSIATSVNWGANIIVSLTFLTLTEVLKNHGAFYLYFCIALIGIATFYFTLPETKGIPLEEVEKVFSGPLFSTNRIDPQFKENTTNSSITKAANEILVS